MLDVTPVSNLRTQVVASLDEHPLRALAAAGVRCSISTDDPALFTTDLTLDYAMADYLGASPEWVYGNGLAGALCGPETRERLRALGETFDWSTADAQPAGLVDTLR